MFEVLTGFEPVNTCFADKSLKPLGYSTIIKSFVDKASSCFTLLDSYLQSLYKDTNYLLDYKIIKVYQHIKWGQPHIGKVQSLDLFFMGVISSLYLSSNSLSAIQESHSPLHHLVLHIIYKLGCLLRFELKIKAPQASVLTPTL